jgi:hypothetical protein
VNRDNVVWTGTNTFEGKRDSWFGGKNSTALNEISTEGFVPEG